MTDAPLTPAEIVAKVKARSAQSRGFERDARAAWDRLAKDVNAALEVAWPPMNDRQKHNNRELVRLRFMTALAAGEPVPQAEETTAAHIRTIRDAWEK